jgi:hypothetical protein
MRKPVAYRQSVRSQLGLVKTDGSRANRFTNMPLADSRPHRSHQGAHRPANGGGRCWVAGRGHAPPEGGLWPLASGRSASLASVSS